MFQHLLYNLLSFGQLGFCIPIAIPFYHHLFFVPLISFLFPLSVKSQSKSNYWFYQWYYHVLPLNFIKITMTCPFKPIKIPINAHEITNKWPWLHITVSAGIIERKLKRTKVRLFTVPCCSIILFSSEGVKKTCIWSSSYFFRRSIILVGALLFYNSVFPHFSHISHYPYHFIFISLSNPH